MEAARAHHALTRPLLMQRARHPVSTRQLGSDAGTSPAAAADYRKLTDQPVVKLELGVGFASRYQSWKYQVWLGSTVGSC